MIILAGLSAADAWIPLFPREPGRRLTESFLRTLLVVYLALVLILPAACGRASLVRARRLGKSRPRTARLAPACTSALLSLFMMEGAAALWLRLAHASPGCPPRSRARRRGKMSSPWW